MYLQITPEADKELEAGAVTEYPPQGFLFVKTPGGFLSSEEILRLLWQEVGTSPVQLYLEKREAEPEILRGASVPTSDRLQMGKKPWNEK